MKNYEGTTTLVTGASKGLGRAYAVELARRKSNLVLVARSAPALEALAAELVETYGVKVDVIAADLSASDSPQKIVSALATNGITVDLLLNNAGVGSVGPFFDRPLEQHLQSVDVNVSGIVALTHVIGRQMLERGQGGIINVASTAAFLPMPYQASYAATKAFMLSFTEAVTAELAGSGVDVMIAHPGPTDTGFFDGTSATMDPKTTDTPESVAAKTLDDFARGKTTSFPGRAFTRVTTWAGRILSRKAVTSLTAGVNRKAGFDNVTDSAASSA